MTASKSDQDDRTRIIVEMPRRLLEAIDDYHFTRRLKSRAAAVRRLIEIGLQHPDEPARRSPPRSS